MISIITMPFQQALCVLLIYVSVIGIVLSFGRATWILTWQSTANFPLIRRIISRECRPQAVIITVALPMLLILPSLILVPSNCNKESYKDSPWFQMICEESYMKLLTDKHPVFQRSLRLATAIAICQFIQTCLEIIPHWRSALSGLTTRSTFFLGGWLLSLAFVGSIWTIEWIARHFAYEITPLSGLSALEWEVFGMTLLAVWILWFLAITSHTLRNVTECELSPRELTGFFERLKYTFVFGQGVIFLRACIHPNMGFVHAQLELTIINLLLPSIYVISLIMLRMISLISVRSLSISVPLSLGLGALIFDGSKMTQKPHSFFVISLFLFDAILRRSGAVPTLSRMGRLPNLLQEMLREKISDAKQPPTFHQTAKIIVYIAGGLVIVFVAAVSGFGVLSVLQRSADWFPDATSLAIQDDTIDIHHTAVVKLHMGLANDTSKAIHLDQPRYASCANRWHGLSIVDLAMFSEAAYFDPTSNDTAEFVSTIFANSLNPVHVRLPKLNTKTGSKLDFYEAYIPSLNTSVISVRGTDIWRFTDFIEDVKMFIEPVIFTILSAIFPTIRIWPDVTFSTLIELYGELTSLFGLQHEFWYYHELLDYVASIKDREVILTGHSMGGGIARLVGSLVDKTSVTFSPPGFVQSYSKLVHDIGGKSTKVNRANLHHLSVAVIPEYDPVAMIDAQAGMIQKISCDTPHLSMQLSCHMLEGTLCNLLDHCGDPRGRIASCRFEHKIASLTENLVPKLSLLFVPELLVTVTVTLAIILSIIFRRRSRLSSAWSPAHRRKTSPVSSHRRHRNNQRRNSII